MRSGRPPKNYIGLRFGKLVVVGSEAVPWVRRGREATRTRYWVLCDCGTRKLVDICELKRTRFGATVSCGCHRISNSKAFVHFRKAGSQERKILSAMKRSAGYRGLVFGITDEDAFRLMSLPCHYCGRLHQNLALANSKNEAWRQESAFAYNGLDRIDSSKGYVSGNVVPSCRQCNTAKGDLSVSEFQEHVLRVCDHLGLDCSSEDF